MSQVVDIDRVSPHGESYTYNRNKMRSVLLRQGQIEPLQVRAVGEMFVTFANDPHGNDIIHAARELGWNNLLICVMLTYEQ